MRCVIDFHRVSPPHFHTLDFFSVSRFSFGIFSLLSRSRLLPSSVENHSVVWSVAPVETNQNVTKVAINSNQMPNVRKHFDSSFMLNDYSVSTWPKKAKLFRFSSFFLFSWFLLFFPRHHFLVTFIDAIRNNQMSCGKQI